MKYRKEEEEYTGKRRSTQEKRGGNIQEKGRGTNRKEEKE